MQNGELELGYWLGKPFWGLGYATEAARRVLSFAFDELEGARSLGGLVPRQSGLRPCAGQARLQGEGSRRVPAWRAAWMSAATW